MDYEATPAPDENPRHRMPEILKRGHLLPEEWPEHAKHLRPLPSDRIETNPQSKA